MKNIKIPLTLERVGSEGKFFTDNLILKIMGTVILTILISLVIVSQLSYYIPNTLAVIVGVIVFIPLTSFCIQRFAIGIKKLLPLLQKMAKHQIVNTNKFSDIQGYADKVALHASGHLSMFLCIERGCTIQGTEDDHLAYYKTLQNLENAILGFNYSFKRYNIENLNLHEFKDVTIKQMKGALDYKRTDNLYNNLKIKYTYVETLMEKVAQDESFIYVIICTEPNIKQFEARVNQLLSIICGKSIANKFLLNQQQIEQFQADFFNTLTTDTSYIQEDTNETILQFKE